MTCASLYADQIRARGYRMTPQRMTILHILHHHGGHLTPAEVYAQALVDLPGMTETTVYRTLEFLTENGLVHQAYLANGHLAYEIAREDHHHLVCRNCGDNLEIEHSLLEKLYRQLEAASGFKLTGGHVTFFGLCPACKKNQSETGE